MDKVGDLLIRIKNSYMASRKEAVVPNSKLTVAILEVLKDEGFIKSYTIDGRNVLLELKYENRQPALTDVKRISKPGRRVYKGSNSLPRVFEGLGIAIISTPKGIMTDIQAREEGVGGEVMAFVW